MRLRLEVRSRQGSLDADARIIELSETGLLVTTKTLHPIGTEIELEYRVHPGDAQPIRVKTIVRRTDEGRIALEQLTLRANDRLQLRSIETLIARVQ